MKINNTFKLGDSILVKNRLMKSAMSEQLADAHHNPTPELIKLYEVWAGGDIGISLTGNVMVDRNQIGEPRNVVLDEQSDLSKFREWAQKGSQNNTQLWMQINHPGKQIPLFLNKEPLAPSAISLGTGLEAVFNTPRELTHDEILDIIQAFARTSRLAKETGFSGVQIHSAHGYLVNQFLSPNHNQRQDQWGGSLENRQRFLVEICRAIRAQVGTDFVIAVKLNSADFMKGGFSEEDSMQVIQTLENEGIDFLEISGGTYESPSMLGDDVGGKPKLQKESTQIREAYFLKYAEKARKQTQLPLAITGGFRSTKAMNHALASGAIDVVGIARPLALDIDFASKALESETFKADFERPKTWSAYVNRMSGLDLAWYEHQLLRIGQGKKPKPKLSPWFIVFKNTFSLSKEMMKQRRA